MRILVIEDFRPLRTAIERGLGEDGYAVDATGDGQEGLCYVRSNPYDVLILDLMLPKVDGLTILRAIRREELAVRVLILTAKDEIEDRVAGLDAGADDYLVKPFAFSELLARVRALVRRHHEQPDPVLCIADLEIDTVAKRVRRVGGVIELTAREYSLLEYLARRADRVVSRTEIWEGIYAFNNNAQSNVVDVYIGYLRKKLNDGGRANLIHTRRAQGYLFGEKP